MVALDALRTVREQDAYANLVLPGLLASRRLEARDAAFATELVYGTLRALGTYDAILGELVDRPLDALDPLVLDVLRLGTHQLLATRIGDHAAVDESVKLVRDKVGHGPTGLVNAVLRKVAARDLAGWCAVISPRFDIDPIGNLSLTHSHPRWIVEGFRDALGGDLDETIALLAADNVRPCGHSRRPAGPVRRRRAGRSRCPTRSVGTDGGDSRRRCPHCTCRRSRRAGRRAGRRQPTGGARPRRVRPSTAATCGGSTCALALAARRHCWPGSPPGAVRGCLPSNASLIARDWSATRSPTPLTSPSPMASHRRGQPHRLIGFWSTSRVLGLVLCGAGPRRAGGALSTDVEALRPQQIALLRSALDAVRPGGLVAYVTCSPHLRETRSVVDEAVTTGRRSSRAHRRPALLARCRAARRRS